MPPVFDRTPPRRGHRRSGLETPRWLRTGAALTLLACLGCGSAQDPGEGPRSAHVVATVARTPLPRIERGVARSELHAKLADWSPGHRYTPDGAAIEGWEWSGPDGGRVEAQFEGAHVLRCAVSRTWGSGAPAVDGHALPDGLVGAPLGSLERAIGPGLLVERSWTDGSRLGRDTVDETWKWSIHDAGIDTGLYLTVAVRDGEVLAVSHRWSRP